VIVGGDEDCIAIRVCFRSFPRADIAACAGKIFDKELLAEMVREFLRQQAAEHVYGAARCEWDDDPDWPAGKRFG
jgi:hypothetical protein